jgi:2-amino-4-hydroxy-6-hydroxymethyldihydropteridine diphosphokinase
MSRAVLSIGSNLGDRLAHLRSVVAALRPVAVSPVYETAPWGGVEQDDYLNAIVVVDDPGTDAYGWLARARELEQAAGRTRAVRWGPRTLDVDVIDVDGGTNADPELTLPHRRRTSAFVLVPWRTWSRRGAARAQVMPTGCGPVRHPSDGSGAAVIGPARVRDLIAYAAAVT